MYKFILKSIAISTLSCMFFVTAHAGNTITKSSKSSNEKTEMITPKTAFPVFIVESLNKAKIFYKANFDFTVAFENEWYLHLVSSSGIQVAFMLPNQPTQPEIFHKSYGGKGVIFSLEVSDADSAYAFAKKKSLDIALELRSEEWGQRHFSIKDPNGVYVDIVQSIQASEEYLQDYKKIEN